MIRAPIVRRDGKPTAVPLGATIDNLVHLAEALVGRPMPPLETTDPAAS